MHGIGFGRNQPLHEGTMRISHGSSRFLFLYVIADNHRVFIGQQHIKGATKLSPSICLRFPKRTSVENGTV